jgi:plastocyanin
MLLFASFPAAIAGDVRGTVVMPPYCSPETSPAVVWLETLDTAKGKTQKTDTPKPAGETVLVRQAAMQFVPRVLVLKKGQPIQFTNEDSEFHNVHVQAREELFNQTMPPGQPTVFTPVGTGILNVFCDIHQHMRAFLFVLETPWAMACGPKGNYRFENVPAGRYRMSLWHEMGRNPVVKEIEVPHDGLELGTIQLTDATAPPSRKSLLARPVTTWPEVIDRISVRLSSSLEAARRPDSRERALSLADSAFQVDYAESGLPQTIRTHLGEQRAAELDAKFRKFADAIRASTKSAKIEITEAPVAMRSLMASLIRVSEDLKAKGVTLIPKEAGKSR